MGGGMLPRCTRQQDRLGAAGGMSTSGGLNWGSARLPRRGHWVVGVQGDQSGALGSTGCVTSATDLRATRREHDPAIGLIASTAAATNARFRWLSYGWTRRLKAVWMSLRTIFLPRSASVTDAPPPTAKTLTVLNSGHRPRCDTTVHGIGTARAVNHSIPRALQNQSMQGSDAS